MDLTKKSSAQYIEFLVIGILANLLWRKREGFTPFEEIPDRLPPGSAKDCMPKLVTLNSPIAGESQQGISDEHFSGLTEKLIKKFLKSRYGNGASVPNTVDLTFSGCQTVRHVRDVYQRILLPTCALQAQREESDTLAVAY